MTINKLLSLFFKPDPFFGLKQRIKLHEGKRNTPYLDSRGVLTVGYGRNLRDVPFSDRTIEVMFENDFKRAKEAAESFFVYPALSDARRGVLIEMIFQMGASKVAEFSNFLDAVEEEDWQRAHDEMLDSKWAKQTPERAKKLAKIFLKG